MIQLQKILQQSLAGALILACSGCASIVSKSQYPVSIDSHPAGASITILDENNREIFAGQTPTIVTLKSGKSYFNGADYRVIAKLPDGRETEMLIASEMDGWFIGNVVFGGLIGFLVVDPLTGAMYKLPDSASVHFDEPVASTKRLQIISKDALPENLQAALIPVDA